MSSAVTHEVFADSTKGPRLTRKVEDQCPVIRERERDELLEIDRSQQASGRTRSERLTGTGHHRDTRKQRVASRRVGIIRKAIEEQIRETQARKMIFARVEERREDHASARH